MTRADRSRNLPRMAESYDVVVVGGGVMGSAVAYFLTADPAFDGRVAVIERDPTYQFCSTTRSWGGVRQQFSTPDNIRMAQFNVGFFRAAHDTLAIGEDVPDLSFRENGYLFLVSEQGLDSLRAVHAVQTALGARVKLLAPDKLKATFPWLNTDGIAAGSFGYADEGWLDPHAVLHAFRRKAIAQGAVFLQDEIRQFVRTGDRIDGVELQSGGRIGAGMVVNCAGWRAGALAATAGIDLPVGPKKRMTYVFDCRDKLKHMPLTIDVTGVATRPEGSQYLGIVSPPPEQDPDRDDFELEYTMFEDVVWPTLAHRIPAFEAVKLTGAWAGHYDYNRFDHNAILGRHPEIAGIVFCNGFSGHGIQQSPAAGRATAELIVHGRYLSLDLSAFDYARIPENRPLWEAAVV